LGLRGDGIECVGGENRMCGGRESVRGENRMCGRRECVGGENKCEELHSLALRWRPFRACSLGRIEYVRGASQPRTEMAPLQGLEFGEN
jgi:hypothetical protein